MSDTTESICLVGFGEVGFNWSKTLIEGGYPVSQLAVLYLAHETGRLAVAQEKANTLGLRLVLEARDIPNSTTMFFHATTTASAESVLELCLPVLNQRHAWIDLNSTGPAMKSRMAERIAKTGAEFGDGAILAPASELGHRTPVWISGNASKRFVAWANEWGTPSEVIPGPPGSTASVKMCRSLILKGIAASLIEGLTVAQLAGVEDRVRTSLAENLGESVVERLCTLFIRRTMEHAERRSIEVRDAIQMASEFNFDAVLAKGVEAFLKQVVLVGGPEIGERFEADAAILRELGLAVAQLHEGGVGKQ